MIEKLSEVAKCELDKGIENVDTKEMGEVAEIIKELSEAEYYAKISKAMDEAEYGEDYDYMGAYDEHERKGYRGQPRSQSGRFMSRGDGRRSNRGRSGRRGYEDMMMYDEDWDEMERMRDMDRVYGRMGYSGSGSGSMGGSSSQGGQLSGGMSGGSSGGSNGGQMGYSESGRGSQGGRDSREGRSGQSRRGYMESKEQGKDKQEKMKELEHYMKDLSEDVTEMISEMSPEEKSLMKQKMQVLTQKIG